jgi:hypothetical protein
MSFFTESLIRTVLPVFAAAVFGSLIYGSEPEFHGILDGECATFVGSSIGNDTTQEVEMLVCRDHDRVSAIKLSQGDGGKTMYSLEGQIIHDEEMRLLVTRTLIDAPSKGWVSCSDDIVFLRFSPAQQALVGRYFSAECHDLAFLFLEKVDAPASCAIGH